MTSRGDLKQNARDEAIAWLVRVESDAATEADWMALADWLEASPDHREAYAEIEMLSSSLADQAALIAPHLVDDAEEPSVVDLVARRTPDDRPDRRRLMIGAGAIAAVLVAGVVGFGLMGGPGKATVYETRPGEERDLDLADGSNIHLNGASHLSVRLGSRQRLVEMGDAEVSFDVARDHLRPFVIMAGDRRVQVVGTEFNVRRHAGQLTVTVRRGVVEVRGVDAASPTVRLTPGKELVHIEGQVASTVRNVTADDAFSWTRGRLVCRDRRLADIVEDLNRQLPVPIVVEGPARDLRFSGVLVVDDEASVLKRLRAYLPVTTTRENGAIRIRSR